LLKQLNATAKVEFVPAMMFAWLHLFLGNLDEALGGLERASENREYELLVAKVAYGFDGFRAHPRFQSILDKLGLGPARVNGEFTVMPFPQWRR
jgi:hypothetical protein